MLTTVMTVGILLMATETSTMFAMPSVEEPDPSSKPDPFQPVSVESGQLAMQAPPLSDFVNIWIDDVDNLEPVVAYNNRHNEYLVVWVNDRGATRDIYARRVAGDGTLKSWFSVASESNHWNYLPDVTYSPVQDEYLIVYTYRYSTDDYDIRARRVGWNGAYMSPEFGINADIDKQWYPAVTYNSENDEYLIVYENYWAGGLRDIDAQRVRASDGVLLGPPSGYNVATAPNTVRRLPDVAYNAARNQYLIAYVYQASATDGHIFGKIASSNFGMLSSEIIICGDSYDQNSPAVVSGPDEYLTVWEDGTSGTSDYDIFARRVSGDGFLQGPDGGFLIAGTATNAYIEPDVAYGNIYGYLVTWRFASGGVSGDDIFGRFVKPGQNTSWGSEFTIDNTQYSQRSPALACGLCGDCLVVESDNWPGGDYEIRGRFILAHHIYLPLTERNWH
jgi:hypothetical protein